MCVKFRPTLQQQPIISVAALDRLDGPNARLDAVLFLPVPRVVGARLREVPEERVPLGFVTPLLVPEALARAGHVETGDDVLVCGQNLESGDAVDESDCDCALAKSRAHLRIAEDAPRM